MLSGPSSRALLGSRSTVGSSSTAGHRTVTHTSTGHRHTGPSSSIPPRAPTATHILGPAQEMASNWLKSPYRARFELTAASSAHRSTARQSVASPPDNHRSLDRNGPCRTHRPRCRQYLMCTPRCKASTDSSHSATPGRSPARSASATHPIAPRTDRTLRQRQCKPRVRYTTLTRDRR